MPPPDALERGLCHALQETDHRRELDSIERITAAAYLRGAGCTGLPADAGDYPRTIGGWLAWIARSSV